MLVLTLSDGCFTKERGEEPLDDLLSQNGLSPETIEKPAPINKLPEGNYELLKTFDKK